MIATGSVAPTGTLILRKLTPAYRMRDGQNVLLKVACYDCNRWHTHGNGYVGREISRAGDVTDRVKHCANIVGSSGVVLLIADQHFDRRWQTPRGAFTKRFRQGMGLAA